jgi:hypothetical protein
MDLLVAILFAVAIMVLGAQAPKPLGWVAIVFALLALVLRLLPHFGR